MNINYELRAPRNSDEWLAYHAIRRKVLFENRREFGVYIENHPDEFKGGHHPLVMVPQWRHNRGDSG